MKTVLLIALLAISREFVILKADTTSAATIASLAAGIVALGIGYRLISERENESAHNRPGETPDRKGAGPP